MLIMVATFLRHHNPREERGWVALRPLQRGGPVLRLQCGHGNAHVEALSLGGCSAVDVGVGADMSLGVGMGLGSMRSSSASERPTYCFSGKR